MKNLNEKLSDMILEYSYQIKYGLLSIFKIDTTTNSFQDLLKEDSDLKNSIYVGTFNSNNTKGTLFFSEKGALIKKSPLTTGYLQFLKLDFNIVYETDIALEDKISITFNNFIKG